VSLNLPLRPRRNRRSAGIRALARETHLHAGDLIYPLFLQEGEADTPIESMPGQTRWSVPGLVAEVGRAHALGVPAVVLFPKIPDELKSSRAEACADDEGLLPRAVRAIKAAVDGGLDRSLAGGLERPGRLAPAPVDGRGGVSP